MTNDTLKIMPFSEVSKTFRIARYQAVIIAELCYIAKYRFDALSEWDIDSFNAFCALPEIGVSINKGNAFADTYKFFVIDNGIKMAHILNVKMSHLKSIKQLSEENGYTQEQISEWIELAQSLSTSDFMAELNEALGRKTPKDILNDEGISGRYELIPASNKVPLEKITSKSVRFFIDDGAKFIEV